MSFFPNSGTARPWPLNYGSKTGGSYIATGNGNAWGGGMAAGSALLSYRWTSSDYYMVIWGVGLQIAVDSAFTAAQLAGVTGYKATSFTAMDTGGSDITSTFAEPRSSSFPTIASFGALTVRMASAGATGLTAGTRALGNPLNGTSIPTGTNAKAVTVPGAYRDITRNPVIIKENEGSITQATYAITGGTIIPQYVIDFDIVPAEIANKIYS